MSDAAEKIAKFWGDRAKIKESMAECHWTDSRLIQRYYIHPTISGNPDSNWLIWVKDKYFSEPADKALSLGCGDGCLERHGAAIKVFRECDAFDISPGAIDIAKRKAEELGFLQRITYDVCDLNEVRLPKKYYDAIFCAMSLHHIENLEYVLDQIKNALKPEGLLIVNEYVGPDRFQWSDKQLDIANELFRLLPEKYRFDPTRNGIKKSIERATVEHMLQTDPSEAARSADIVRLIEERFKVVDHIRYGGTIVNLVLDNIIVNFDESKPEDMAILKLIFYFERLLIREKLLDNNFAMIVSKRKSRWPT